MTSEEIIINKTLITLFGNKSEQDTCQGIFALQLDLVEAIQHR